MRTDTTTINNTISTDTNSLTNVIVNHLTDSPMIYSITISLFLLLFFLKYKQKNHIIDSNIKESDINKWREERRKRGKNEINIDDINNNLNNSHTLWKKLSKLVHETKFMKHDEGTRLSAENLNKKLNENKSNYKALVGIESEINQFLNNINN